MQDIVKIDEQNYKWKRTKVYDFSEFSLPIVFLIDTHEGYLSLKDAHKEQSNFAGKIKNLNKSKKTIEKYFFWNNLGLFFSAKENVINNFKHKLFRIRN